jgi:hypothetical protein
MKKWYFKLRRSKAFLGEEELKSYDDDRDLDVPHIADNAGGYVVFVRRLGVRKYGFGKPVTFEGQVKVIVSNADVAEATRSYDMNAKVFGKKDNMMWVVGGYIVICLLILILMIVLVNKFDVMKEISANFAQGAANLAQAKQAAIPSGAPV